jgi:hypothetical protein
MPPGKSVAAPVAQGISAGVRTARACGSARAKSPVRSLFRIGAGQTVWEWIIDPEVELDCAERAEREDEREYRL